MLVLRRTLDGTCVDFDFGAKIAQFLVKNLSDDPILVNFEEITSENEETSVKIMSGMGQLILDNLYFSDTGRHDKIYIKGTGEVEVQPVLW